MKKLMVLLIFIFCAFSIFCENLTLEDCKIAARKNIPLIMQYSLIEKSEKYSVDALLTSWIPRFSVFGKYTYQSDVIQFPQLPPTIPISFPTLTKDQFQVAAEVSQNLWDGGVNSAQVKNVRATAAAEKKSLDVQMYTLDGRIQQLFFGVILINSQIEQNALLQTELESNYKTLQTAKQNGVATASDLDEVSLQLLNVKQNKISLESTKKTYILMIEHMTGKKIETNTDFILPQIPLQIQTGSENAFQNRPEMLSFEAQKNAVTSLKSLNLATALPNLSVFFQGGYGKPALNMFDSNANPFWITGIKLAWKIDNFWSLASNNAKIDANVLSLQVQKDTFVYNTNLALLQQIELVNKLQQLIESDNDIVAAQNRIKNAGEAKQKNGVITVSEQLRNITNESLAKSLQKIHQIQLIQALVEYNYIMGK